MSHTARAKRRKQTSSQGSGKLTTLYWRERMNYTRHPKYENKQPRVYKHGVFVGANNSQTLTGSKKLIVERRKRMRVAPACLLLRADSTANSFRTTGVTPYAANFEQAKHA